MPLRELRREQLAAAAIDEFGGIYGNLKAGALVLEGEVHRQDGQVIHQRITWKAEGKGVRESAVMSRMAARPGRRRSTCCS